MRRLMLVGLASLRLAREGHAFLVGMRGVSSDTCSYRPYTLSRTGSAGSVPRPSITSVSGLIFPRPKPMA